MIEVIRVLDTNYSYIITKNCGSLIVDPGESTPILELIKTTNITPKGILLTHNHSDHTYGVKDLIKVYPNMEIIDYKSKSTLLKEFNIEIILTPGHTTGSCCFYIPKENAVFTGDTLFTGLCGRIMDGDYKMLFNSLQLLKKLPEDTKVYPGHEYLKNSIDFMDTINIDSTFYRLQEKKIHPSLNTTIGLEIMHNIFMTKDFEKFKKLRTLKG